MEQKVNEEYLEELAETDSQWKPVVDTIINQGMIGVVSGKYTSVFCACRETDLVVSLDSSDLVFRIEDQRVVCVNYCDIYKPMGIDEFCDWLIEVHTEELVPIT